MGVERRSGEQLPGALEAVVEGNLADRFPLASALNLQSRMQVKFLQRLIVRELQLFDGPELLESRGLEVAEDRSLAVAQQNDGQLRERVVVLVELDQPLISQRAGNRGRT